MLAAAYEEDYASTATRCHRAGADDPHIYIHFGAWVYPSIRHTLVRAPTGQKAYDRPYVS